MILSPGMKHTVGTRQSDGKWTSCAFNEGRLIGRLMELSAASHHATRVGAAIKDAPANTQSIHQILQLQAEDLDSWTVHHDTISSFLLGLVQVTIRPFHQGLLIAILPRLDHSGADSHNKLASLESERGVLLLSLLLGLDAESEILPDRGSFG